MNVKLLVDAIVRQTTVLIAQLSTAAGVRAPLAHLADQVFLSLAREIEAQGVGKKVVADMFGIALRSYQRKTQRLGASPSNQGKTLFEAVLQYIHEHDGATRAAVLARFSSDGERETIGVLTDLVHSGLLHITGAGSDTLYGLTSEAERQRLTREVDHVALSDMAWGAVYRSPDISLNELAAQLNCEPTRLEAAIAALLEDGRVVEVQGTSERRLRAATFQIPAEAERGWESAVFDHFQAVATAIASKLTQRGSAADQAGLLGGTTLRFELHGAHPHASEVMRLLQRTRNETMALWNLVSDYNDAHPAPNADRFNLCFYFGQTVDDTDRSPLTIEPARTAQ